MQQLCAVGLVRADDQGSSYLAASSLDLSNGILGGQQDDLVQWVAGIMEKGVARMADGLQALPREFLGVDSPDLPDELRYDPRQQVSFGLKIHHQTVHEWENTVSQRHSAPVVDSSDSARESAVGDDAENGDGTETDKHIYLYMTMSFRLDA